LRGKGAAGRCEAAGSKKPEAYSLEYVEDFFGPRTTQVLQIVFRSRMVLLGQTPREKEDKKEIPDACTSTGSEDEDG
jgi:hypothetical protein